MADAMSAVLGNSDLRERLARDGYQRAWTMFRQSRVTDAYMSAYRQILSEEAVL
jgi:glycosyltransferase involved in cell wall biosynthesis